MTQTKHTPAPWTVTLHTDTYGAYTVHPFAERQEAAEGEDQIDPLAGEDLANRQLIEAAPELLASLEETLFHSLSLGAPHPESRAARQIEKARAALAKARG